MSDKAFKPGEPRGDPARHVPLVRLTSGLAALRAAPRDEGTVSLVVRRLADGRREAPAKIRLSREEGVPGDDWQRRLPCDLEA